MKRRCDLKLAAFTAFFLSTSAVALAAIQGRETVCQLTMGNWQLCEKDGRVYLIEDSPDRSSRWSVSSPTIKDAKGRFLAADSMGRNPSVHLVTENGPHASWTFEIIDHLSLKKVDVGGGQKMWEGNAGFRFKVRLAEGPMRGWYLAAGDLPEENTTRKVESRLRPLKLVKDPKQAAVFTYVHTKYEVHHK